MSSWRVVDSDPTRPVRLSLGGTEYVLTVPEAMALLRGAPRMAGEWELRRDEWAARYDASGLRVACVWHQSMHHETGIECWVARTVAGDVAGVWMIEAMNAADAALVAAGYVLAPTAREEESDV